MEQAEGLDVGQIVEDFAEHKAQRIVFKQSTYTANLGVQLLFTAQI